MKPTRVNEIDLLRFIAALAIVFFHYSFRGYAADWMTTMPYPLLASGSKYGFLGVQLFFMISGFVILMTANNGGLRDFVVSRVVRLYPAFWVCCTITFIAIIMIGGQRYSASISQYLVNMTMLSGFVGVDSIDSVYWSLFVELRFYALVAIVLLFGMIHRAQAIIISWLVVSIALEIYPSHNLRYLLIVDDSEFFIAGAMYFLVWSKGLSLTRFAVIFAAWCLAVFKSTNALRGFEEYFNTSMSAYISTAIISAFFAAMLLVSLKRTGMVGRANWTHIGVITYPLYLLHQNIGFMIFNISHKILNVHLVFWGVIIAALIAAYAIHVLIEKRLSLVMKDKLIKISDGVRIRVFRFGGD